jgi:hippurate hydrolase
MVKNWGAACCTTDYDFNDASLPYGASYWVKLVSAYLDPAD